MFPIEEISSETFKQVGLWMIHADTEISASVDWFQNRCLISVKGTICAGFSFYHDCEVTVDTDKPIM